MENSRIQYDVTMLTLIIHQLKSASEFFSCNIWILKLSNMEHSPCRNVEINIIYKFRMLINQDSYSFSCSWHISWSNAFEIHLDVLVSREILCGALKVANQFRCTKSVHRLHRRLCDPFSSAQGESLILQEEFHAAHVPSRGKKQKVLQVCPRHVWDQVISGGKTFGRG